MFDLKIGSGLLVSDGSFNVGKEVPSVQIPDEKINRMQGNILQAVNQLVKVPFSEGLLLKNQTLQSGANTVNHRLQREIQGYLILKQNAAATIFGGNYGRTSVTLTASATVTVDLWVF